MPQKYKNSSAARLVKELLHRSSDDGEHVVVEVEVNDVLETEPLGVIKSAGLLQNEWLEGGRGKEEPYMLLHLPLLGVARHILVLPYLALNRSIKPELLFDDTHHARLRCWVCLNVPFGKGPSAKDVVDEREVVLPLVLGIDDSSAHLL